MYVYLSLRFSKLAVGPLPSRRAIPKRKVVSTKTERTACTKIFIIFQTGFAPGKDYQIVFASPDQRKPSLPRTSEMFQGCLQFQLHLISMMLIFCLTIFIHCIDWSYFSRGAHRKSALERHGKDQLPTSGSFEGCHSFLKLLAA